MQYVNLDERFPVGAAFHLEGDACDLRIPDYNVRVCSTARVYMQPSRRAQKVLVEIDEIDGDRKVCVFIAKKVLLKN